MQVDWQTDQNRKRKKTGGLGVLDLLVILVLSVILVSSGTTVGPATFRCRRTANFFHRRREIVQYQQLKEPVVVLRLCLRPVQHAAGTDLFP